MRLSSTDHPIVTGLKALATSSYQYGALRQTLQTIQGLFHRPPDNYDHGNNAPTALLVHGFFCTARVMETLGNQMNETMNVAYAPDFSFLNTGDVRESAQLLRAKISEVLEHEKNGDLTILGHSLGGIITVEILRNDRMELRRVITCAAPFRGTPQARLAGFLQVCRQLSPGSSYLQSLERADLSKIPLDIHVSADDSVIPPENQVPVQPLDQKPTTHPFQHFDFILGQSSRDFAKYIVSTL